MRSFVRFECQYSGWENSVHLALKDRGIGVDTWTLSAKNTKFRRQVPPELLSEGGEGFLSSLVLHDWFLFVEWWNFVVVQVQ